MNRSEKRTWISVGLVLAGILLWKSRAVERLANILPRMSVRVDPKGDGHFGSKRSGHTHQGTDFLVNEGDGVDSPIDGRIVRYGYAYRDSATYRNIVIRGEGVEIKIMYARLMSGVNVGDTVKRGEQIGVAQAVSQRYGGPPMRDHIHVEARRIAGDQLMNPEHLFHLT